MKKFIIAAVLCAACWPLSSAAQDDTSTKWKLTWEDNFDKENFIDPKKWDKIPRGTSDWDRNMSDDPRCYSVKDSKLILRGIVNDMEPQDTAKFHTGGVWTKNTMGFKYGKVEICAKIGSATGAWPAFWGLAKNLKWPAGGEIDIMEHLNYEDSVYQTIHSNYTLVLKEKTNPQYSAKVPFNKGEFNVFGMEKHPDKIVFTINGKVTHVYPKIETDKEGQFPFNVPFYILIDMQLGGSWVGEVNPSELPVEMEIDWVKIYKPSKK